MRDWGQEHGFGRELVGDLAVLDGCLDIWQAPGEATGGQAVSVTWDVSRGGQF